MKTPLLIEQHFHGAYGVDFNKAGPDDIIGLSYKLRKLGIGGFFPTLVTDSVQNINRQIAIIKEAAKVVLLFWEYTLREFLLTLQRKEYTIRSTFWSLLLRTSKKLRMIL